MAITRSRCRCSEAPAFVISFRASTQDSCPSKLHAVTKSVFARGHLCPEVDGCLPDARPMRMAMHKERLPMRMESQSEIVEGCVLDEKRAVLPEGPADEAI
jgi:hypothetical protein